jgi:hypothetical protein
MPVLDLLRLQRWGLDEARTAAHRLLARRDRRRAVRALVTCLVTEDREQRIRAADVARRITERDANLSLRTLPSWHRSSPKYPSLKAAPAGTSASSSPAPPALRVRFASLPKSSGSSPKTRATLSAAPPSKVSACWRTAIARYAAASNHSSTRRSSPAAMRVRARDALRGLQSSGRKQPSA